MKSNNLRDLCDLLAEDGAVDPNAEYEEESFNTLLNVAIENNNNEAVKLLLSAGAKADQINSVRKVTPIHLAATKGDPEVLKLLIGT